MNEFFRLTVLPDELDRSYLGRIMRINQFQSEKEAVTAMAARFEMAHLSRRELSCLELLGLTADLPLEVFAQQHSTIPLRRAITSSLPHLPHGSATRRSLLYNFGMVAVRTGAYLCAQCAGADLAEYGVGYWHREHQIPGQLWCRQHLTPLIYMRHDVAFLRSTTSCIPDAEAAPNESVESALNNEFVRRYIDVVSGLVKRKAPLNVKYVALALRKQATSLGLNTVAVPVKNRPLLSDRILESFPGSWLANVVPTLVEKPKGQILNRVDGVLYLATSASSVWSYILAAAVLYESSEDALNGLTSAEADFADIPRRKRTEYGKLDSTEIYDAYVECNGIHTLVAARWAVPLHRATLLLRAAGLPNLSGRHSNIKNVRAAANAFHIQERSFDESARIGGLTATEMSSLVRYAAPHFRSTLIAMDGPRVNRGTGVKRVKGYLPQEAKTLFRTRLARLDPGQELSSQGN
jgi:hypothetical protein